MADPRLSSPIFRPLYTKDHQTFAAVFPASCSVSGILASKVQHCPKPRRRFLLPNFETPIAPISDHVAVLQLLAKGAHRLHAEK